MTGLALHFPGRLDLPPLKITTTTYTENLTASRTAGTLFTLNDGDGVNVCRALGEAVTGPSESPSCWDAIDPSGVVSDAYLGVSDQLPDC